MGPPPAKALRGRRGAPFRSTRSCSRWSSPYSDSRESLWTRSSAYIAFPVFLLLSSGRLHSIITAVLLLHVACTTCSTYYYSVVWFSRMCVGCGCGVVWHAHNVTRRGGDDERVEAGERNPLRGPRRGGGMGGGAAGGDRGGDASRGAQLDQGGDGHH